MGLMDWMKKGKGRKDVNVREIAEQTIEMGAMVAGNQTAANAALDRMMAQKTATTKILMVQDGDYMVQVTEYALKMAQRLDCEVVALDVTDEPLQFSGDRQSRECERFNQKAKESNSQFAMQAEAAGVAMVHVMEIADPEAVVARLSEEDAGIRYVLTKPDRESQRLSKDQAQVPVYDLNCSRLSR